MGIAKLGLGVAKFGLIVAKEMGRRDVRMGWNQKRWENAKLELGLPKLSEDKLGEGLARLRWDVANKLLQL